MATAAYRDKFRKWVNDYAATNELREVIEADDDYLDDAFDDALDEANYAIGPTLQSAWTLTTFPSFAILKFGVLLHLMMGLSAWSARNAIDYTDSGGVNVRSFNKWEKYQQLKPDLTRRWEMGVNKIKINANFSAGWGDSASEYAIYYN